jgi:ankyrin repeat protein
MDRHSDKQPLHQAVEQRQVERAKELLRAGARVDARDKLNVTPLMIAAREGFNELVELLLAAGASVTAKDRASRLQNGKRTPLFHACEMGHVETARILLKHGADPDCTDQDLRTPFSNALGGGEQEMAELLLEFGANPNGPVECYDPPIVAAAEAGDAAFVKRLLDMNVDPNRIGAGGDTALTATGSVECACELLRRGAEINLRNAAGKTPLLQKRFSGSLELLKCYVDAGADVNVADADKVTVLMHLTNRPEIKLAELLIEAGADINALPVPNVSVLDFISSSSSCNDIEERQALIRFLRSKGAKTAKELKTVR